jgi:16S rRNA (uracil1498-N3)-methyltransferase
VAGPHFFVATADVDGRRAVLRGEDARHLAVVLRVAPGDEVSLSDGAGTCWMGRVDRASAAEVGVALGAAVRHDPPRPRLTVVHALPKARKLDGVVQRLVEIGVDRLVPVHSARTEVRLGPDKAAKAVARWRAVALAAAKQSRRAWLFDVAPVGEWTTAFAGAGAGAVCWEEATVPLRAVDAAAVELTLGIGPEGGLTAEEVAASGLPAVSLGPTVLRTETAALVAASILLHRAGRLG